MHSELDMPLTLSVTGVFLNGRAEKVRKNKMFTQPALHKIWHEEPYSLNLEGMLLVNFHHPNVQFQILAPIF